MKKVAIIGASGYTGAELIRLLHQHSGVRIAALAAYRYAGKEIAEIYPHLTILDLPTLQKVEEVDFSDIDIVFCCLPHGTTQEIIKTLPKHLKIIDLSADFRLKNIATYEKWYRPHQAKELQKTAVYGLSEIYREEIKTARLVACAGCYPTSMLLPLMPLFREKAITGDIISDSKTGLTGGGRTVSEAKLFCEINESVKAYSINSHRHAPEVEEKLGQFGEAEVTFTPHLIPMDRGILSTIYVNLKTDIASAKKILEEQYANEPFVHILAGDELPSTHMAKGTNHCFINIFAGKGDKAVIVSVIDNLVKGASGQAIQNMNIMCGFAETEGINQIGIFP